MKMCTSSVVCVTCLYTLYLNIHSVVGLVFIFGNIPCNLKYHVIFYNGLDIVFLNHIILFSLDMVRYTFVLPAVLPNLYAGFSKFHVHDFYDKNNAMRHE